MKPSLPIVDVGATGFGRAVRSLPRLLAMFCLPWLIGTVALISLEVVLQDHLRVGWAPNWARTLVWAPFAAAAYVGLLRWVLGEQAPTRPLDCDVTQFVLAAPVTAAWFLTLDALEAGPIAMLPASGRGETVASIRRAPGVEPAEPGH
jgi:hypothetical protein